MPLRHQDTKNHKEICISCLTIGETLSLGTFVAIPDF
jgi:hypothetical protein